MNKLLVVIPTFNEAQSAPDLIEKLVALKIDLDILIVDDGSLDNTIELCESIDVTESFCNVNVLQRGRKMGLASAYIDGFRWALESGYESVAQMDADLSHRPEDFALMYGEISANTDCIVIGSRWIVGGATENWSLLRKVLSRLGNHYARLMLKLETYDSTSGFRIYPTSFLARVPFHEIKSEGYCFQIEMTQFVARSGIKVVEVPITFVERVRGKSKMTFGIALEAVKNVTVWGVLERLRNQP